MSTTENPEFILIGDSHAGAIGKAARARGIPFTGGPIASGRAFFEPFCETRPRLRFLDPEVEEMHQELRRLLGVACLSEASAPVLSTIGSGFHFPAARVLWEAFLTPGGSLEASVGESALVAEVLQRMLQPMLGFHEALLKTGLQVCFVLPPQRIPDSAHEALFQAVQSQAVAGLEDLGCQLLDLRTATCDAQGRLRAEFCQENDPIHANEAWGDELLRAFGATPQI